MTISPEFLEEIRHRVPVSSVAARHVKLTRAGREMKGCCPFHSEKTPSFYINDDKAFYHCFGCGAHGDVIRFTIEQEGLGFRDAVESLAAQAGLKMPAETADSQERARSSADLHDVMARATNWYSDQLAGPAGGAGRAYLERRGLSPATVKAFGLGVAPDGKTKLKAALDSLGEAKLTEAGLLIVPEDGGASYDRFRGRLMFPIRDPRGRVIAFGGRILGDGQPKYLNSPDTPLFDKGRTLYNFDRASPIARKSRRLIVVEGYMDVIALSQAGFEDVVAPLGTALTEAQLGMMWRAVPEPILCFDGDAAGRKAAVRAAERALPLLQPGQSLSIATLPAGQDPDDLIRDNGNAAFAAVLSAATPLFEFIWNYVLAENDTSTPERRALVEKILKDYTATIGDQTVRSQYSLLFRERFWAKFGRQGERSNVVNVNFQSKRSLEALMVPVHEHEAVAIVAGLLNYPKIASDLIESLGRLPITIPRVSTLCQAIVDAVAWYPEISRDELAALLRSQGVSGTVAKIRRSIRHPFSFTNARLATDTAARDLKACIEFAVRLSDLSREFGRLAVLAFASHQKTDASPELLAIHGDYETEKARLHGELLHVREKMHEYVDEHRGEPAQSGYYPTVTPEADAKDEVAEQQRVAA